MQTKVDMRENTCIHMRAADLHAAPGHRGHGGAALGDYH